jgi:dynein light intermediate chain 1
MIVLDWTHPWTFVEELKTWLNWVENWAKGDGTRELEIIREECRERCEFVGKILYVLMLTIFRIVS